MNALPGSGRFILGVGGTTRPGSLTEAALRCAMTLAAEMGAETAMIAGPELAVPMYQAHCAERTPEAHRLVSLLRRCDGLILSTPSYHGTLSGLMKNALDYTEDMREDEAPYLDGRAVGCIVCAAGAQAFGTTLTAMRSIVHALRGWPTPLGVVVNSERAAFEADGACAEPSLRVQLATMVGQVLEFARARALVAGLDRRPGVPPALVRS